MQECRDIFGNIEISAGMWNTYKNTHFKLPTKSQTHKISSIKKKKKKITGFAFFRIGRSFFVFFFVF